MAEGGDRTRRLTTLVLSVSLFASCQSGPLRDGFGLQQPAPTVPSERGVGPRAAFAVAAAEGVLGAAADGKILGHIAALPPGTQPSGLALHPDGKRLFFALTNNAPPLGFGSDIYSVNLDGTDFRPVVKREEANVFYATPVFDAKGNLYVHRRQGDLSGTNIAAFQEVKDVIERVDVATGQRKTVIPDGADPTVNAAGTQIIYVKYDRGQATDLWIASTDGLHAEKFLKTDDWFSYLQSPRISPSGRDVLWSSVPPTQPKKSSRSGNTPARGGASAGGKLAHLNIPSELFVAPIDGSSIRSIFVTADDVVPTWSSDGARIAFITRSTFWVVSTDGRVITQTDNVAIAYGDVVWLNRS